jgi:hypothetical protein
MEETSYNGLQAGEETEGQEDLYARDDEHPVKFRNDFIFLLDKLATALEALSLQRKPTFVLCRYLISSKLTYSSAQGSGDYCNECYEAQKTTVFLDLNNMSYLLDST